MSHPVFVRRVTVNMYIAKVTTYKRGRNDHSRGRNVQVAKRPVKRRNVQGAKRQRGETSINLIIHGALDYENIFAVLLPRDAVHKRGYSRHAVSVSPYVCLTRSWIMSKRINISSKFFHHRVATPF